MANFLLRRSTVAHIDLSWIFGLYLGSGSHQADLKDYMRQAGEVTYADAHKNRRNEGIVEFSSSSDLKAAIDKLDGTELNGRKIRLIEDKSRRRRSRSSSGSHSRSRSRSSFRGELWRHVSWPGGKDGKRK
ncbi:hypothetical protein RUM43_010652 [Polyplax serrata]|uniref:RRM domain-containing protein n=1 Tax=Polyplax serrata TaxID=468196 RepID=A0AAN8SA10_POLSC